MTDFIITFRETLEASLIVGIVLAYLSQTNRKVYNHIIYLAVFLAVIGSVITAFLFNIFLGGFTGVAEEIFEGVAMIVASIMVSSIVVWMMNQKRNLGALHKEIDYHFSKRQEWGLFILVFLSVLREGVETVIFLGASSLSSGNSFLFSGAGIVSAILVGVGIFKAGVKFNLKQFFFWSSAFLILFGAGLFAHGVHELQEAHIVPIIVEHVWDINPKFEEGQPYPAFHEKGSVGGLFKDLFGYNGNPSLIEVASYVLYLNSIYWLYFYNNKRKTSLKK